MYRKLFKNFDYTIVVTTLLLTAFGLIMVYSASSITTDPPYLYFKKQLIWIIIGLGAGSVGLLLPYKMYQMFVKPVTIIMIFMLVIVLFIGKVAGNASSWLQVGGLNIQPAEIVKIAIIMYLSSVFSKKQENLDSFKSGVLPPLIIIGIFFVLIYKQPDLGSAMIVLGIAAVMVLCSGMKLKHIAALVGAGTAGMILLFTFFLSGEQSSRITSTYHPFGVVRDGGWQIINSYIAIASGGFTGKGLGQSIEKAGYLPEAHTDFIMAVIAEELGVLGVFFVIICLMYLVLRGIVIGIKCQDVFGSLMAIGISAFIGIETIVNLGAVTGLLPVTGVTLPFISYGGSSLVILLFSMGILVNISGFVNYRETKTAEREEAS